MKWTQREDELIRTTRHGIRRLPQREYVRYLKYLYDITFAGRSFASVYARVRRLEANHVNRRANNPSGMAYA